MPRVTNDYSPPPTRILPPVVLLAAILFALALDRWLPLAELWGRPWTFLGGGLILVALGVNVYCALQLRRRETTVIPFQPSTALVTDGLFHYSRNPIYLSMVVLLVGETIALGSLSPWLVPPLLMATIQRRFIRHEEAMLAATFGEEFDAYCRRVRRWL